MSEDKSAGGADAGSSGTEETQEQTTEQKVAYETYKKVLDEKKSFQKRLDEFERKAKEQAEAQLREKEQYRELYEAKEKEFQEIAERLKVKEEETQNYQKMGAFLKNVTGDIPQQYWGLIELGKIVIDETGKVDETSVKKAVKDFERLYPEVIKRAKSTMPNDAATGAKGSLSYDEWLKLPYDEKRKRQKDVQI